GGNIRVVVRCRPLNAREIARGATCLIRMDGDQTIITKPSLAGQPKEEDTKAFTFDRSYWSADKNDPNFATQKTVYNDLGRELLDHAFHGYNCCIFAYGQTGSGKSYSMMGYGKDKGIIPLTCSELFDRIAESTTDVLSFQVEVSYIEIYNEKVRDLLNPSNKSNLKVREHPSLGPYVEDLSRLAVKSFEDISHLMNEGNKARTVAATNMNETSSRSHAVFTIFLTSARYDETAKLSTEKVARISLVDLAGSERADSTGATGMRLKEGANINKSLTTLGKVISSLAEHGDTKKGKKSKEAFVPYRDSVLTWLLKDSLGGNSKTAMIAAISPADYEETLSTLRYADQAKKIKNKAVVNEDPNAKLIRELKEELQALRDTLMVYAPDEVDRIVAHGHLIDGTTPRTDTQKPPIHTPEAEAVVPQEIVFTDASGHTQHLTREEVVDQLQTAEKLLNQVNRTWEEKLHSTETIHQDREKALEELGVMVEKNNMGVYTPKSVPHLVNLNEDPLMTECLVYQLKPGKTRVGRLDSTIPAEIRLSGPNIKDNHCFFEHNDGIVTLYPDEGSMTMVNGMRISDSKRLHSGFRVILGDYHVFRFNHPEEARRERDLQQRTTGSAAGLEPGSSQALDMMCRPVSPSASSMREMAQSPEVVDWGFARREAVLNYYSAESNLGGLTDEDLEKLFDDVFRIRQSRKKRFDGRSEADPDDETLSRTSTSSSARPSHGQSTVFGEDQSVSSLYLDTSTMTPNRDDLLPDKIEQVRAEMERMMDQQRYAYESKIKRIAMHLPPGTSLQSPTLPSVATEHETILIYQTFLKWKSLRYVWMAETIMSHAALLKEANVISKELNKNVIYQFFVLHDHASVNPVSFWESGSELQPKGGGRLSRLSSETMPCVGVLVVDRKHEVTYVWSIEETQARLVRMRSLYDFTERPLENNESLTEQQDPFYESPCPRYSLLGLAKVPIQNLAFQVPVESMVDVVCRHSGHVLGHLRVLITPIARSMARRAGNSQLTLPLSRQSSRDSHQERFLHVGQQQVFEVRIISLDGLSESDATQVHAQFRLSSFGNIEPNSPVDRIYATDPISGFGTLPIDFHYAQTLSTTVTADMLEVITTKTLTVEIHGHLQSHFLRNMVQQSVEREELASPVATRPRMTLEPIPPAHSRRPSVSSVLSIATTNGGGRNMCEDSPEDGQIREEVHDIVAWVKICELEAEGEYEPVRVVYDSNNNNPKKSDGGGVFSLRQGLQRRISLSLMHASGRKLRWEAIEEMSIGNVRLLNSKGQEIAPAVHSDVPVYLFAEQELVYHSNGTSTLSAQGPWDSSLHNSLYLNRVSPDNQLVLLSLSWKVNCSSQCTVPIKFSMDLAVMIQERDASGGGGGIGGGLGAGLTAAVFSFLRSQRILRKMSAIFVLKLHPPMSRKLKDLWRLNTTHRYVRGEELLGPWRPRGVSLVHEYREARQRMILRENVAVTRHTLLLGQQQQSRVLKRGQSVSVRPRCRDQTDEKVLLDKVIRLWKLKFGEQKEVRSGDNKGGSCACDMMWELMFANLGSDTVTKKGFLLHPENANEVWVKHWFVLKRPYIIIYTDQSETDERGILSLTSFRVDYTKDLEDILQRTNVFAIYTNHNCYLLEAPDRTTMVDWISKIDQFYPVDSL
ncbi:hypothetical protein J3Q64DRAFT_1864411, partial [Phycomyces blakesleeanus]